MICVETSLEKVEKMENVDLLDEETTRIVEMIVALRKQQKYQTADAQLAMKTDISELAWPVAMEKNENEKEKLQGNVGEEILQNRKTVKSVLFAENDTFCGAEMKMLQNCNKNFNDDITEEEIGAILKRRPGRREYQ